MCFALSALQLYTFVIYKTIWRSTTAKTAMHSNAMPSVLERPDKPDQVRKGAFVMNRLLYAQVLLYSADGKPFCSMQRACLNTCMSINILCVTWFNLVCTGLYICKTHICMLSLMTSQALHDNCSTVVTRELVQQACTVDYTAPEGIL